MNPNPGQAHALGPAAFRATGILALLSSSYCAVLVLQSYGANLLSVDTYPNRPPRIPAAIFYYYWVGLLPFLLVALVASLWRGGWKGPKHLLAGLLTDTDQAPSLEARHAVLCSATQAVFLAGLALALAGAYATVVQGLEPIAYPARFSAALHHTFSVSINAVLLGALVLAPAADRHGASIALRPVLAGEWLVASALFLLPNGLAFSLAFVSP